MKASSSPKSRFGSSVGRSVGIPILVSIIYFSAVGFELKGSEQSHKIVPACSGILNGTWVRQVMNSTNTSSLELWQFNSSSLCDLNSLDIEPIVQRLRNRTIYFIGDSLMRNFMNSVVDVLKPGDCAFSQPLAMLVNGTVQAPFKTYRDPSCVLRRPEGWNDGTVHFEAPLNLTLTFLWNPWYPPWNINIGSESAAQSNKPCVDRLEDLGIPVRMAEYVKTQTVTRNCACVKSMLQNLSTFDESSLFVVTYPALTQQTPSADEYMRTTFPLVLQSFKGRVVFISHLQDQNVVDVVKILQTLHIPHVYYGDAAVARPETWYDKLHVSGPLQWIAGKSTLSRLASLSPSD